MKLHFISRAKINIFFQIYDLLQNIFFVSFFFFYLSVQKKLFIMVKNKNKMIKTGVVWTRKRYSDKMTFGELMLVRFNHL